MIWTVRGPQFTSVTRRCFLPQPNSGSGQLDYLIKPLCRGAECAVDLGGGCTCGGDVAAEAGPSRCVQVLLVANAIHPAWFRLPSKRCAPASLEDGDDFHTGRRQAFAEGSAIVDRQEFAPGQRP